MKHAVFLLATVFISSMTACLFDRAKAAPLKVDANDPKAWTGDWYRDDRTGFYAAEVNFKSEPENQLSFSINASNGANEGEVDGAFALHGNTIKWKSPDQAGKILFTISSDKLMVKTEGDWQGVLGNGVFLDGEYKRQKPKPFEWPLKEAGIFKSEVLEKQFRQLTGDHYELFVHSMQLVGKEEVTPKFKAVLFSGCVRGLASNMKGIIAVGEEGRLWAAVLDQEEKPVVHYFTNVPGDRKTPPKPIAGWCAECTADGKAVLLCH